MSYLLVAILQQEPLYAEQWGDAVVTNTYLKITILARSLLCAGSLWIFLGERRADNFGFTTWVQAQQPLESVRRILVSLNEK